MAAVYAALQAPELINLFAGWAITLTLLAAMTRLLSLYRNARLKPKSTARSAIGVRHSKIRQIAQVGWNAAAQLVGIKPKNDKIRQVAKLVRNAAA